MPGLSRHPNPPVFVFAGQGSQWRTMGRGLLAERPFRRAIEACDALILPRLGWSLLEELERGEASSRLHTSLIAQPAIFGVQVALTALLEHWGVRPGAVIGHSVGEVAAAHAAGVLSLEDAARVICAQNRIMARVAGQGAMLFAALSAAEIAPVVAAWGERVSLASTTSPRSCVLSGGDELTEIERTLVARGVFARRLDVDIAFHGPQIEPHVDELRALVDGIRTRQARIPVYSTVRGGAARDGDFGEGYWPRHMRVPVRFAEAVATALAEHHDVFVEVGPHPVLAHSIAECAEAAAIRVHGLATLRRAQPEKPELLGLLARLDGLGHPVEWSRLTVDDRAVAAALRDDGAAGADVRADLASAPPALRRRRVHAAIREALRATSGGAIDPEAGDDARGFLEMGLDSLTSLRLAEHLSSALGLPLSPTTAFDYPNVASLSAYLDACVTGERAPASPVAPAAPGADAPAAPGADEPIALIGMACRFPGGANDGDAFWKVLIENRDAVTDIPGDRWDVDAFFDPNPDAPGKAYSRWGGFLEGVRLDAFDAAFFNVPPVEARALDPQQRLLLEVSFEALEHAGIAPRDLRGKAVGVFVGISTDDYKGAHLWSGDPTRIDAYSALGSMPSAAAGRLSYFLGLRGPSLAVDTACSSSLVALHLACRSLGAGESEAALVAGVNTITNPYLYVYFSKLRALSPDGRCKTFSADANGYSRAEGCGVLVLKRLSRARADGDRILAVIPGTAVNQDGASSSFTAPNGLAQEEVIASALRAAGVGPRELDYVEAHGTGTPLGDPIEVASLARVYGPGRGRGEALLVGSVKANVGHLEAAAGMAGVIKVVLALQHETIPPHHLFGELSPRIPWADVAVRVPTEAVAWRHGTRPRRAAVSAFGFSGTNAHVVIADPPAESPRDADAPPARSDAPAGRSDAPPAQSDAPPARPHVLALSARDGQALRETAMRFAQTLADAGPARTADVCFTANTGRNHFERRLLVTGASAGELAARLSSFGAGHAAPGRVVGPSARRHDGTLVFVFSGQGAQYAGMGRTLYDTQPLFRETLDRCATILGPLAGRSLPARLYGPDVDAAALDETAVTQPALFAFEYALAQVWMSWGIVPTAVIGHSVGEYVAACLADVFSLEDALALVAQRGRLMQGLPRDGAMATLFCAEARARDYLAPHEDRVSVAAVNADEAVVISGERDAVRAVCARAERDGVRSRSLRVSHAFHSPLMTPILEAFERAAGAVRYSRPSIPVASNVTGALAGGDDLTQPGYWSRQLRQTVRFADGLRALAHGHHAFLEIGPSATLAALGRDVVPDALWASSLRRGEPDWEAMIGALGQLYVHGFDVDWKRFEGTRRRKVALPSYPFQRKHYWMATAPPAPAGGRAVTDEGHPVIGRRITSPALGDTVIFETTLGADRPALLKDHRIFGRVIVPAAVELGLLLTAARDGMSRARCDVRDVTFTAPLIVPTDRDAQIQLIVDEARRDVMPIRLVARPAGAADDAWRTHCSATLVATTTTPARGDLPETLRGRLGAPEPAAPLYERLTGRGVLTLGPSFRPIEHIRFGEREALCELRVEADQAGWALSPRLIEPLLQALLFAAGGPERFAAGQTWLPRAAGVVRFHGLPGRFHGLPGATTLWCHARITDVHEQTCTGDATLVDADGRVVLEVLGFIWTDVDETALRRSVGIHDVDRRLYATAWRESTDPPRRTHTPVAETTVIFADDGGTAARVAGLLDRRGVPHVVVSRGPAFTRSAPRQFTVDPESRDDVAEVFRALARDGVRALGPVAYLWGLDGTPADRLDAPALLREQRAACGGLLHVIQALLEHGVGRPRLHVVTRDIHVEGVAAPPLAAASLWGMTRVLALEHPELLGATIDLDDPADPRALELLVDEWGRERDGDRVRIQHGRRAVARLERAAFDHTAPRGWPPRADATYLITGGLGPLGLATAGWLVAHGARHLVLVARTTDRAEARDDLATLRARGARIELRRVDVSVTDEVRALLDEIAAGMPPLRGVIHAAGTLDDGAFLQQSWPRYERVLAPKAHGAWNLHCLTEALALDAFVLFSSAVTIVGHPGQGNYAAANAFLEALARYRRARGLPAVAIAWGPWAGRGMAAKPAHRAALEARGVRPIAPETYLELLGDTMTHGAGSIGVLDADWRTLASASPSERAFYADLVDGAATEAGGEPAPAGLGPAAPAALRALVTAAPAGDQLRVVIRFVAGLVGEVLGAEDREPLADELPLMDQGFDSLMAIELRRRLEHASGLSLPVGLMFSHPTVNDLSRDLHERLTGAPVTDPAAPAAAGAAAAAELARLDALDPDALEALILKDLERTS